MQTVVLWEQAKLYSSASFIHITLGNRGQARGSKSCLAMEAHRSPSTVHDHRVYIGIEPHRSPSTTHGQLFCKGR